MSRYRVLEMIDKPSLGGGQKAVVLLAGALNAATFDVAVCSPPDGPLDEELRKIGVRHIPAAFSRRHWRDNIREIGHILRRESIDVLHTHGGVAGFFGRWAAWQAKTQVIVHTLHGIHYLHYRNPVLKRLFIHLERDFSRFTDRLVLVSDGDRLSAVRHKLAPESKMVVIKNGVDLRGLPSPGEAAQLRRDLGWDPASPIVGTVSRLHRQKGVAYLVRAAARMRDKVPGLKVLCVGGGPLESRIRRLVARLGLQDTVRLVGETPEAAKHLAALDVFVLPSLWEGLPFVLIEAAALRKPIVATDVVGNREVITNGETGLLVPPKDPGALAAAVVRLITQPELSAPMGQAAARLIPPRFALSRMIRETEELYLSVWREKHPLSR